MQACVIRELYTDAAEMLCCCVTFRWDFNPLDPSGESPQGRSYTCMRMGSAQRRSQLVHMSCLPVFCQRCLCPPWTLHLQAALY